MHSELAPSSAKQWVGCPAYVRMTSGIKNEGGNEADEGTLAHDIASKLAGMAGFGQHLFEVSDEMRSAIEIYLNHIMSRGYTSWGAEVSLQMPNIHADMFGTCDFVGIDSDNKILYIDDFKYGFGIVEEFENWQLISYYAGVLNAHPEVDDTWKVHLTIVQPRAFSKAGPIRTWKTSVAELRPYLNRLVHAANEAFNPKAWARAGEHCKYCEARHKCEAAIKAGMTLYEITSQVSTDELSPQALGVRLAIVQDAIKFLEYQETGISAQIEALLRAGTPVEGWAMEPTVGRETWKISYQEGMDLGVLLGVDLAKKELITPKQARDKGINADVVKSFSHYPSKGFGLVRQTDFNIRKVFNNG